jgi:hypothetical protein
MCSITIGHTSARNHPTHAEQVQLIHRRISNFYSDPAPLSQQSDVGRHSHVDPEKG